MAAVAAAAVAAAAAVMAALEEEGEEVVALEVEGMVAGRVARVPASRKLDTGKEENVFTRPVLYKPNSHDAHVGPFFAMR